MTSKRGEERGNSRRKNYVPRKIYHEKTDKTDPLVEMMSGDGGEKGPEPASTPVIVEASEPVEALHTSNPVQATEEPSKNVSELEKSELTLELTDEQLQEKLKEIEEFRKKALVTNSFSKNLNKREVEKEKELSMTGGNDTKKSKRIYKKREADTSFLSFN